MVISGPKEPESMEVYFRDTIDAFKKYGPSSSQGMRVTEHGNGREFGHKIFLGGVYAGTGTAITGHRNAWEAQCWARAWAWEHM